MDLTFRGGQETTQVRTPTASLVERRYPGALAIGAHAHEYACIDLVLSGAVHERYRSRDRGARAGELLFYEPDARHAWRSGPAGARVLHLILPRDVVSHSFDMPIEATCLPRLALELDRAFRAPDALTLESIVAEIVTEASGAPTLERTRPAWLDDAVDMALHANPTLSELAHAAGVNAGHLVRTFRERFGCTPGELSRRARVRQAARRLTTSDDSIALIAIDVGFADQAHLTRVFRRWYGVTPGTFRARYRSDAQQPS